MNITPEIELGICELDKCTELRNPRMPTLYNTLWALSFDIELENVISNFIPLKTSWWLVFETRYPLGSVWIYPSKTGGITDTFFHQQANIDLFKNVPWLAGNPCLTDPRSIFDAELEPFDAFNRMKWYVQRLVKWLESADKSLLIRDGEQFELPDFRCISDTKCEVIVTWDESEETFQKWEDLPKNGSEFGWCSAGYSYHFRNSLCITKYLNKDHQVIRETRWNVNPLRKELFIDNISEYQVGWILIQSVPVVNNWQPPQTWKELRFALSKQAISIEVFNKSIQSMLLQLNRQKRVTNLLDPKRNVLDPIILLGFPLPKFHKGENVEQYWLPISIKLANHKGKFDRGVWEETQNKYMNDDSIVHWLNSENWNQTRLFSRSGIHSEMRLKKVAVLGCGSVGSLICQLLVRGGLENLVVIDNEELEIGNLARHTLDGVAIGENKSKAMAEQLRSISPWISTKTFSDNLHSPNQMVIQELETCDWIINCTASDRVVYMLSKLTFQTKKHFATISILPSLDRIAVIRFDGLSFPYDTYYAKFRQEIDSLSEHAQPQIMYEGPGCYSPFFPLSYSKVMELTSVAFEWIQSTIKLDFNSLVLTTLRNKCEEQRSE